jgi:hypothetical protein
MLRILLTGLWVSALCMFVFSALRTGLCEGLQHMFVYRVLCLGLCVGVCAGLYLGVACSALCRFVCRFVSRC